MTLRPEFFDIYIELAVEFRLPVRLPSTVSERDAGFPFRQLAAEEGVVFPDHFIPARRAGSRARVERAVARAPAGRDRAARAARHRHAGGAGHVAELGRVGGRLRAGHPTSDRCGELLERAGAILIGFRELRGLMR